MSRHDRKLAAFGHRGGGIMAVRAVTWTVRDN
jgi:hypothetical protein